MLGLKSTYYAAEMGRFETDNPDDAREHFEIKGSYLTKPSNARLYRNRVFITKILEILEQAGARLFAAIWRKNYTASE